MKTYKELQFMDDAQFKRLIGVTKETFEFLQSTYLNAIEEKSCSAGIGGRPPKLSPEGELFLMLEYYREYRTFAHLGLSYGVSEATACRTVRNVELILMQSGKFSLPSNRCLSSGEIEAIVVDVTEIPIQRPKKSTNRKSIIQERKNGIQ